MSALRPASLAVLLALSPGGCGDDVPDAQIMGTLGMGDDGGAASTTGPDDDDDDDEATDTGEDPGEPILELHLDFEVRQSIDIVVSRQDDGDIIVSYSPFRGFGVMEDMGAYSGPGRIDVYPEAGATVYTARIDGAPVAGGPCGDQPVSLAFSMHVEEHAEYYAGGIAAYCGADTWHGVPVIEPLRMAGLAEPPP